MIDSDGIPYDGWSIYRTDRNDMLWFTMTYTRTECIKKFMKYVPEGVTWRDVREGRWGGREPYRCIKVKVVAT